METPSAGVTHNAAGSPGQRRPLETLALIFVSVALLSGSGVLFSAQLTIGKMLESRSVHDRAMLLRADARYRQLLPFQLLAIALVTYIAVSRIYTSKTPRPMSGILRQFALFVGWFALLLLFDYAIGNTLFSDWDVTLVQWLGR